MKVKCEITLEIESGNYEVKVHNLSSPGEPLEVSRIAEILRRVVNNWDEESKGADSESPV